MVKKITLAFGSVAMAIAPTAATAATFGYDLHLTVPVHCSVQHQPTGTVVASPGAVSLGTFQEYCNAPGGYEVVVSYSPGSLQGMQLIAGNDQVVLDGSGFATLSRTEGPRVREREITAIPGEQGFDADHFDLQIIPRI